jgi:hypothetical protein
LINSALYREPQMLDSKLHRHKRLNGPLDFSVTKNMHAVFLTATEFPQAAAEYPIIFVNTGERMPDGKAMVSPVALLGLTANENLRLDNGRWTARYMPGFIRRFPFLTAHMEGNDAPGVFVDIAWEGFNDTVGDRIFDDEGHPTDTLKRVVDYLQSFDKEQQRTRLFCARLIELDVLKEMTADATLPNGESVKVEGFLSVDEDKLNALPDATVLELHRSGMLMLLNAHLISMSNIRDLLERKALRMAAHAKAAKGAKPAAPAAKSTA